MKSKENNNPWWKNFYVYVIVAWLILSGICFAPFVEKNCHDCADQLTVVGTITSIIGFIAALYQIYKARKSAESAASAVSESTKRINKFISSSEVASFKHIPGRIKDFLNTKQYSRANDLMERLRDFFVEMSQNPEYKQEKNNIQAHIGSLAEHLDALSCVTNVSSKNRKVIIQTLDDIDVYLGTIANKAKFSAVKEAIDA